MPPLPDDLRKPLENAVKSAREHAESGARAALERLHVHHADSKALPAGFTAEQRALRVRLRAHARQLGDRVPGEGPQCIDRLVGECAYEFWHRMLFARYLAENGLLIHPDHGVAMSLEECRELAEAEGADPWEVAARCAARMLPQIFRPEDPLLRVPFAPEHRHALEKVLGGLKPEVFTADDSLGWVYQFWQAKEKERVNASEVKIGGDELPAVTQLFTEPYMVQFLLHNTLGAWWMAKEAARRGCKPAEVTLPGYALEYLRFREDGTPAAGTFPGWPKSAGELKVLDPCCGSGHFLVAAFDLLVRIRMHDEGLGAREACDGVLRDNLFGLELDARCTQIAAFNLALAAWKFPDAGGYRELPQMHIACSGQAPKGKREEWLKLAGKDSRLRWGMDLLYDLFRQANDLGSLIDPRGVKAAPGFAAGFDELQPLLRQALEREDVRADAEMMAAGVAAQGIARAAELLAGHYHLVSTNVPYLTRGKQGDILREFIEEHHAAAKADLATAFLERCLTLCAPGGSIIDWEDGGEGMARLQGMRAWGKCGVAVRLMRNLPSALFLGAIFDSNLSPIVPHNPTHLSAIWAFCQSPEFRKAVRRLNQKLNVAEATLVKVPFDLEHWQQVAREMGPLPRPHSDDPTQWLFKGDVAAAEAPHNLQVALARLLGYRWPDQPADKLDALALKDGILPLPALGDEPAASERLRALLAAAYGDDWSPARQEALLAAAGFGGKSLHEWLRDGFFEQHCKLFHNRPFLWHVWDGKKEGFSAVLNYHKLDRKRLETLIHHHLGLWLKRQKEAVDRGEGGADGRLAAAEELRKKLLLILEGEQPYDVFVRWKPLEKQPVGWEPDLNDGVRLNIRPFVRADVLRKKVPSLHWKKDKGRDPKSAPWYQLFGGDRINDHHLSLAEKKAARSRAGIGTGT